MTKSRIASALLALTIGVAVATVAMPAAAQGHADLLFSPDAAPRPSDPYPQFQGGMKVSTSPSARPGGQVKVFDGTIGAAPQPSPSAHPKVPSLKVK
jgi:hypothetical protein